MIQLSGNWRSFYRYVSSDRGDDEFWGRHTLLAKQTKSKLTLESVPGSPSHVMLALQLSADDKTAEGTWQEETEPDGYYKGRVYEGTITLEISADAQRMSGTWHGKGADGVMNSNVWELTKNGAAQPDGADGDPTAPESEKVG